jgi:hypothetical protein
VDSGVFAPVLTFQKLFDDEGVPITSDEVRGPMGVHKRVSLYFFFVFLLYLSIYVSLLTMFFFVYSDEKLREYTKESVCYLYISSLYAYLSQSFEYLFFCLVFKDTMGAHKRVSLLSF